jgi:phage baseplate assembly protein W
MANSDRYRYFENHIKGQNDQIFDYAPTFGPTGDLDRISGIDVVVVAVRTLLLTPLGYYPFDPQYGSLLYKKLFEPSDSVTIEEIKYEIESRISQYENRAKIEDILIKYTPDKKSVIINVILKRGDLKGTVSLSFNENNRMFGLEDELTRGGIS